LSKTSPGHRIQTAAAAPAYRGRPNEAGGASSVRHRGALRRYR